MLHEVLSLKSAAPSANEEFHPQSQVIWVNVIAVIYMSTSRHCSNIYMLCEACKINLGFIWIQVNQNISFKRIILSFVYFWQIIFFWAVMLNITETNIWACQDNNSFAKTFELEILVFSTEFSYSIGVSSNFPLQIRKL